MRHVAILTTGLAFGGAETQLVRLAMGLQARGWTVSVLCILPPQAFTEELGAREIPVYTLNLRARPASLRAFPAAIGLLKRLRPDALVSFNLPANILGRLLGKLAGIPAVITSIRTESIGRGRRLALRLTDGWSTVTATNSRIVAEKLVRAGVVSAARAAVIPNGLDIERFQVAPEVRAARRAELGLAPETFLWVAVGRLQPAKDYHTLLEAVGRLAPDAPPLLVAVAGQGALHAELAGRAAELGVAERVRFLGLRRDIPALLNAADALVLSSAWEGMPNAVMEALAAARPVVTTEVGGVRELVLEGGSGFIVPPRDADALAAAMQRLMHLPAETRMAMGQAGYQHIYDHYRVEQVISQWEQVICGAIPRDGVQQTV
ncbi:MAG TPA: glycosyltransferase [Armatimonadota bacterium]|nr:glycosyltransferase [Armatimonadota bacterium]